MSVLGLGVQGGVHSSIRDPWSLVPAMQQKILRLSEMSGEVFDTKWLLPLLLPPKKRSSRSRVWTDGREG